MGKITMAGGAARHFDPGDDLVIVSIWINPRRQRLWMWLTRCSSAHGRAPTFREAWRGIVEERATVLAIDGESMRYRMEQ